MAIKVAINGFGRIGRSILRIAYNDKDIDFVAINDITDAKTLAHLFKYDSVHRTFPEEVAWSDEYISVAKREIPILSERNPANLPWKEMGVDLAIESTGIFKHKNDAKAHIDAGAKKVLISAFTKTADAILVYGVNHDTYQPKHHKYISAASCTTNCLAPVAKALHDEFVIKSGIMTTTHAYTATQRILDAPHKDLRRARAAAESMIPTTTGAAKALQYIVPELEGIMDGLAIRVPTPDVSIIDLSCDIEKKTTVEELNAYMKETAESEFEGVLEYTDEPLVSTDYISNPASSIFDAELTRVINGNFIKVFAWYDNEWGFACRMVDIIKMVEREG